MISRTFIDRPILAIVLSLFIIIAGLAAMRILPIAQYPEIAPPVVTVFASYPGASASVLEQTVAAPLENQINGIEDMLYMSSTSTSNGSDSGSASICDQFLSRRFSISLCRICEASVLVRASSSILK
mgnify:CR=1 FL=1